MVVSLYLHLSRLLAVIVEITTISEIYNKNILKATEIVDKSRNKDFPDKQLNDILPVLCSSEYISNFELSVEIGIIH